jgi:hypothetical protein
MPCLLWSCGYDLICVAPVVDWSHARCRAVDFIYLISQRDISLWFMVCQPEPEIIYVLLPGAAAMLKNYSVQYPVQVELFLAPETPDTQV